MRRLFFDFMNFGRKRYLIPLFVVFFLLFRFAAEIGRERIPRSGYRVVDVIDGDTVELEGGEKLRLIGIDCPEKGEHLYDSAGAFLTHLILGRNITLKFGQRRRDGFGRLLGYIFLDSLFVNREMVRQGLAYVYLFSDDAGHRARVKTLVAAQNEAIDARRGLWGITRHAEPYYVVRRGSLRFHRPVCEAVRDLKPEEYIVFDTREEAARRGYSPCRNCRP